MSLSLSPSNFLTALWGSAGILFFNRGVLLHGQKKRRKRTIEGKIEIGELVSDWHLLSEPLWSNEHGYKGFRVSIQAEEAGRGLVLQYPYPTNKSGSPCHFPSARSSQPNQLRKMFAWQ